jgi:hypothetical protein
MTSFSLFLLIYLTIGLALGLFVKLYLKSDKEDLDEEEASFLKEVEENEESDILFYGAILFWPAVFYAMFFDND